MRLADHSTGNNSTYNTLNGQRSEVYFLKAQVGSRRGVRPAGILVPPEHGPDDLIELVEEAGASPISEG